MLIQILILDGGSPIFGWEPQEPFSPSPQNFDQSCILSLESYRERFIFYKMSERSRIFFKKPEKVKIFVWEPIERLNLEPKFLTWTFYKPKKLKSKRGIKLVE
jgi:hypothetical protein